jgi:uncharacterized protein (DUF1501 family)
MEHTVPITRRGFLMGCSGAIAAMAAGKVSRLVFADPAYAAGSDPILVVLFLRGGCDGLSLLSPYDDPVYRQARGDLALPLSGANVPLRLEPRNASYGTSSFGLNGLMPHLKELYDAGTLALVHACGLNDDTRSHFDAMDYMERGTPGEKGTDSGWISRHLQAAGAGTGLLPVVSADSATPAALLGYGGAVAMSRPSDFDLETIWRYNRPEESYPMLQALERLYPGTGLNPLDIAGKRTLQTIRTIQAMGSTDYSPRAGVSYPSGSLGDALKTVAQLVKLEQGLRVATVDFGGWDTHENQAGSDGSGYLPGRLATLSQGLHALASDLVDYLPRLTVVTMSEFGRRLGRNASNGTDHGHGNVMMVLGGGINGGKIYGAWPGLQNLDQGQDLRITTDYRVVLSELLSKRLGDPKLGTVFPGLTAAQYQPLGLVSGADPRPIIWSADEPVIPAAVGPHKSFLPQISRCT